MCNLSSVTKSQQAIREFYRVVTDLTGSLPSMLGVFPDYPAPIVRNGPDGRELVKARWGMHAVTGDLAARQAHGPARDKHPERKVAALAPVARTGKPLSGTVYVVLGK